MSCLFCIVFMYCAFLGFIIIKYALILNFEHELTSFLRSLVSGYRVRLHGFRFDVHLGV